VPVEPAEKQLALAKRITKGEGMSIAAARRLVLKERSKAGDAKAYANEHGPRRSITTIESIIVDTSDRIGVYLDMPGPDINRLIDSVDHLAKRRLIEAIEEHADNLKALANAVRSRLPKLGVRKAG
jgi:hypothetical protein